MHACALSMEVMPTVDPNQIFTYLGGEIHSDQQMLLLKVIHPESKRTQTNKVVKYLLVPALTMLFLDITTYAKKNFILILTKTPHIARTQLLLCKVLIFSLIKVVYVI